MQKEQQQQQQQQHTHTEGKLDPPIYRVIVPPKCTRKQVLPPHVQPTMLLYSDVLAGREEFNSNYH